MIIRNVIKAILLVAILISLHFFIRQDYQTLAFAGVILLIVCVEFFFPKKWGGK